MIQFNPLLLAFLILFFFRSATQLILNRLNISHIREHGNAVPEVFQDALDQERLKKISSYTADSAGFGIICSLVSQAFLLVILLSGFLPWLVKNIHHWGFGLVFGGLVFFACLSVLTSLLRIPFSLYGTFVI